MGFTAIVECACGQGSIVGYGSVYGNTPYKHCQKDIVCAEPKPNELPVKIVDGIIKPEDVIKEKANG